MSTDGRDRMESIWSQIQNWMENTEWTDADAADRVTQAVRDGGVDKFIDPLPGVPFPEAASGNYADIKQEFGLETKRERDTTRRDFEDRQKAAAADEVEDQFREYGIQAVADAFDQQAPPALQERFDDVFAEFGPDFYREIAFNEIGQVVDQFDLDAELISQDRLTSLQQAADQRDTSTAEQMRNAERQVLNRLERSFGGMRFDDLDGAVTRIRDRIDALQQLDVRTGEVRIKGRRDGPPAVTTEVGFGTFEQTTKEQASRAIDASEVNVRRTYDKRLGSVRVAGDELQLIDLTPALELPEVAGAVVNPDALVRRFEIGADVAAPPAPEVTDPDLPDEDDDDDDEPRVDPDEVFDAPNTQGSLIPDAEDDAGDGGDGGPVEGISDVIRDERDGWNCDPRSINNGECDQFADAVVERVDGAETVDNLEFGLQVADMEGGGSGGEHVWVFYDGRHYDSETPEGVEDWRDLPFFQRFFTDEVLGEAEVREPRFGGREVYHPELNPYPDEEPDSEDETPTPDASDEGIDPAVAELVETANAATPDGIEEVGAALTTDELFRLAAAASRDESVEELLDPVFEAFQSASADERSTAAARHDGLAELQRSLLGVAPNEMRDPGDVEIEFEGDVESVEDLIDEAEPGREPDDDDSPPGRQDNITDPRDDPRQGPLDPEDIVGGLSDLIDNTSGIRALPGSNRPDPNQQDADKKIASLLSNRLMKAQAWIAAEQERLSRGPENVERFWETRGQQIWGNTLTEREFTDITVNGLM